MPQASRAVGLPKTHTSRYVVPHSQSTTRGLAKTLAAARQIA